MERTVQCSLILEVVSQSAAVFMLQQVLYLCNSIRVVTWIMNIQITEAPTLGCNVAGEAGEASGDWAW